MRGRNGGWGCWPRAGRGTHAPTAFLAPAQVYRSHVYVQHYREGFETRNAAALMLISAAVRASPVPLPDIDAVVATWDYSGAERHVTWAFCELMDSQAPPKFLIPGGCVGGWWDHLARSVPPLSSPLSSPGSSPHSSPFTADRQSYRPPPPLCCCSDQGFWQWPEAKLQPWPVLRQALFERGRNSSVADKTPKIVWRGAANLNPVRQVPAPCTHAFTGPSINSRQMVGCLLGCMPAATTYRALLPAAEKMLPGYYAVLSHRPGGPARPRAGIQPRCRRRLLLLGTPAQALLDVLKGRPYADAASIDFADLRNRDPAALGLWKDTEALCDYQYQAYTEGHSWSGARAARGAGGGVGAVPAC
jgi:hypothetical protein